MKKLVLVTVLCLTTSLFGCGGSTSQQTDANTQQQEEVTSQQEETVDQQEDSQIPESISQVNARIAAETYLSVMPFSHSKLVTQLEYEGYSNEDAIYAADNCSADWNEQAALSAQLYLDMTSFSRSGLLEQLEYEGYSAEQAEYGVQAVGY